MAAGAISVKDIANSAGPLVIAAAVVGLVSIMLTITSCESVSSVGVTAGYGNDMVTVGVTIVFKEAPSAETVAALEAANAVRIKSSPEIWALGRYSIDDKSQVKAVDAAIKDGGVIERIE